MFGKRVLVGLGTLLLLGLAACGSSPTATPTATQSAPAATATPSDGTMPTAMPTQPPTATVAPTPTQGPPYFQGKTLRIISTYAPGGGHDFYARLLAKYMPQFLPGNPQTIVQNMVGAGSIIGANYVYNQAKPDGLTIVDLSGNLITNALVGTQGMNFDLTKFQWIGRVEGGGFTCFVMASTGIKNLQDLINSPKAIPFGVAANTEWAPALLRDGLGANVQIIRGYSGSTAEATVAMEQGTIDGWCTDWQGIAAARPSWITDGTVVPVVVTQPGDHLPQAPNVPTLTDLQSQFKSQDLYREIVAADAGDALQYIYAAPPATPDNVTKMLQDAFTKAVSLSSFQSDAARTQRGVDPLTGPQVSQQIADIINGVSPQIKDALKQFFQS